MIRVAVAGAGQWGRNHVRVLAALPGARLAWVADPDPRRRQAAQDLAPRAQVVADVASALADPRLDAVVIASPAPSHGAIARAALDAGKHVLVEKPLTPGSAEAWGLVRRARRRGLVLGVGHLLIYHPAVRVLKRVVGRASFGAIRYIRCQRTNLGRIRDGEGALESLAPHDVSVMVDLIGCWPIAVSARGARHLQPASEDVVFVTVRFPGDVLGEIVLSWLEPLKVRSVTVVGSGAMAVWDDMAGAIPLSVYRTRMPDAARAAGRPWTPAPTLRSTPRVPAREPLREELRAFLASVRSGRPMPTPGEDGARVAQVLDAAERSLAQGGREVRIRGAAS